MPKQLDILEQNLLLAYRKWSSLSEELQAKKVNLILPFIQLAGYCRTLRELASQDVSELDIALGDFREKYQRHFDCDIAMMNVSDISPELMARIAEVQAGGAALKESEREHLLQYRHKYSHAHSRILYNYGLFLATTQTKLTPAEQEALAANLAALTATEDAREALHLLSQLNQQFELEKHSTALAKDDLENHALLNQMSNYNQNISQVAEILLDEAKLAEFEKTLDHDAARTEIRRAPVVVDEVALSVEKDRLKAKGVLMTVGLETEFLLRPIHQQVEEMSETQKNVCLKEALADINARRRMQTKYGLTPTLPEIHDMTKFFVGEEDEDVVVLEESSDEKDLVVETVVSSTTPDTAASVVTTKRFITKRDFTQIVGDLEERLPIEEKPLAKIWAANFTDAEVFFYKLFFLGTDAEAHKIEMDGVFYPDKSKTENFARILPLLRAGRFHESLLDMIQAHEVAIGPHDFTQIIPEKRAALTAMRLEANCCDTALLDPNVQVNLSFFVNGQCVLSPQIGAEGDTTIIHYNQLAVEFLRVIEEVVAESGVETGVLRNQSEVSAALDRKKHLGAKDEVKHSKYLTIDPSKAAFLNHKMMAAKNVTLRLSAINDTVGVCEIRLVGNNPHFARIDSAQVVDQSGIDFIPELLIPRIAARISTFVETKTSEKIATMLATPVMVTHDGKIAGLDCVAVPKITRDPLYNSDAHRHVNLRRAIDGVSIVPYHNSMAAEARAWEEEKSAESDEEDGRYERRGAHGKGVLTEARGEAIFDTTRKRIRT